jgi:hypothetical protein
MKIEFDRNTFISEDMLNKKGPLVNPNAGGTTGHQHHNGVSRNTSIGNGAGIVGGTMIGNALG